MVVTMAEASATTSGTTEVGSGGAIARATSGKTNAAGRMETGSGETAAAIGQAATAAGAAADKTGGTAATAVGAMLLLRVA